MWKHPNVLAGIGMYMYVYMCIFLVWEVTNMMQFGCLCLFRQSISSTCSFFAYVYFTRQFCAAVNNSFAFTLTMFAFLLRSFWCQATSSDASRVFLISIANEVCYLVPVHDSQSRKEILAHLIMLVFAFQRKLVFAWQRKVVACDQILAVSLGSVSATIVHLLGARMEMGLRYVR